jgi:hypothetical protein
MGYIVAPQAHNSMSFLTRLRRRDVTFCMPPPPKQAHRRLFCARTRGRINTAIQESGATRIDVIDAAAHIANGDGIAAFARRYDDADIDYRHEKRGADHVSDLPGFQGIDAAEQHVAGCGSSACGWSFIPSAC